MGTARHFGVGLLLSACACASSPASGPPATDPLAECTPGPKANGGRSFSCGGFTVQWEASDDPAARAEELLARSRARLLAAGAVGDGAVQEERSSERLRLRSAERPLFDAYPLEGPRGSMVLLCTYPKADGASACADVRRALLSREQTGYWAPPVTGE